MNKIICDICGTSYPETAEQCPICGYSRDFHVEPLAEDEEFLLDDKFDLDEEVAVAAVAEAQARKGNADQLDMDVEEEDEASGDDAEEVEDEEEEEEGKKPSAILTVLLVLVTLALLAVAGFIFVKYYLPGMKADPTPTETTTVTEFVETTTGEIACTSLVMTSDGEVLLEQVGNTWLIHVVAMPEDTTDEVIFASSDESVATVSQTGTVTAVSEGQAVITITCGEQKLTCDVTCEFVVETTVPDVTVPETDATTEPVTDESTAATEEATEDVTETTEATEATEQPTEAPTEAPTKPAVDVELKLNKKDISFDRIGVYSTLKVSKGIDPADVEWTTSNSGVCVVHEGKVTITGAGMAIVTAKYQGQEATCIIRVVLKK